MYIYVNYGNLITFIFLCIYIAKYYFLLYKMQQKNGVFLRFVIFSTQSVHIPVLYIFFRRFPENNLNLNDNNFFRKIRVLHPPHQLLNQSSSQSLLRHADSGKERFCPCKVFNIVITGNGYVPGDRHSPAFQIPDDIQRNVIIGTDNGFRNIRKTIQGRFHFLGRIIPVFNVVRSIMELSASMPASSSAFRYP